jgi:ribosomal protein L32
MTITAKDQASTCMNCGQIEAAHTTASRICFGTNGKTCWMPRLAPLADFAEVPPYRDHMPWVQAPSAYEYNTGFNAGIVAAGALLVKLAKDQASTCMNCGQIEAAHTTASRICFGTNGKTCWMPRLAPLADFAEVPPYRDHMPWVQAPSAYEYNTGFNAGIVAAGALLVKLAQVASKVDQTPYTGHAEGILRAAASDVLDLMKDPR